MSKPALFVERVADLIGVAKAMAELIDSPKSVLRPTASSDEFIVTRENATLLQHKARRILPLCRALLERAPRPVRKEPE